MLGRVETAARRWRRRFSRSEWLARLLNLPAAEKATTAGLLLIQIDGLSRPELDKALANGEMPFLKRLRDREHYQLHDLYSGVPATTSAVQGELFYGVKAVVPAFAFVERQSGRLVRMFEPDIATRVEEKLQKQGAAPLLKNGSCYMGNYRGGAAEPHFCPAALGWGPAFRNARPLVLAFMLITHIWSFIRITTLLLVEVILAISDCIRGLINGQDLLRELLFVPTRIVITILMRELATVGAKIDIARGLPTIHLNFLGYDEQAHRRGPDSAFAHWTLKGIDGAVSRIWRSAHRSVWRHYDVWVYSDHGQERTRPYRDGNGQPLTEALAAVISTHKNKSLTLAATEQRGVELTRIRLFGGRWIQRLFPIRDSDNTVPDTPPPVVSTLGPVAMLYYPVQTALEQHQLARRIAEQTGVPLVLVKDTNSGAGEQAHGWWTGGAVHLPRDGARILGANHPFLKEASRDLVALCHHPDAGDFVICGWRIGANPVSFAVENGAHGGAGANETHAFALLPADIPAPGPRPDYWRPDDLRVAALRYLHTPLDARPTKTTKSAANKTSLRLMTYNVHRCVGMDGKLSPERVARIIARQAPDIVALQELDVDRIRTGKVDQARQIADLLAMDYHFHPAIHLAEERYGNAVLSRLPMRLVRADILPGIPGRVRLEPRGALWVAIDCGSTEIQVITTHLGLQSAERQRQIKALLGSDWLGNPACQRPRILCGDLNAGPNSSECRALQTQLHDVQLRFGSHRPAGTFFSRFPRARIDHIFLDPTLKVTDIVVPRTELTKLASDHLPLITEFQLPNEDS